jgi:hypothetical protein
VLDTGCHLSSLVFEMIEIFLLALKRQHLNLSVQVVHPCSKHRGQHVPHLLAMSVYLTARCCLPGTTHAGRTDTEQQPSIEEHRLALV